MIIMITVIVITVIIITVITITKAKNMCKFVGREIELKNLNKMYNSPNFEMAVVYGRRRVGKTSLIKQFISKKSAIYVQGVEATSETNLRFLSNTILNFEDPERNNRNKIFSDYQEAFEEIQDIANHQDEKLIFVMDEFPYFAESERSISSILQYEIDNLYKANNNIMLILCGSSMSFMEHQVLGYKSPLYGRKTGQFKIRPFNIFDTRKMLLKVTDDDLMAYYGITDGIPQYLSFIDQNKSLQENIKELFLAQNAPLQNEPNVLLQEELRKPATYFSILNALAHGKTKNSEISQAIGMNSNSISQYLNNLIDLEIIERKQPILENNKRKFIYAFKDNMFKFWFRFIAEYQDQIALERTKGLLANIMEELPRFLGPVFEQASKDWLWQEENLPFEPKSIGNWWGNNPILRKQEEIDIVAINYNDSEAIVGECKWRNADKLNHEMVDTLIRRSTLLPKIKRSYLYFFTKETTNNFLKYAQEHNVRVIKYAEFFLNK